MLIAAVQRPTDIQIVHAMKISYCTNLEKRDVVLLVELPRLELLLHTIWKRLLPFTLCEYFMRNWPIEVAQNYIYMHESQFFLCLSFAFYFFVCGFLRCPLGCCPFLLTAVFWPVLPTSSTRPFVSPFLDWVTYICLYFLCLSDLTPACFVTTTLDCESFSKAPFVFYICECLNLVGML